jgi:hypothetical protein
LQANFPIPCPPSSVAVRIAQSKFWKACRPTAN